MPPKDGIKVLTINLCADWQAPRQDRGDKIIDLVRQEQVDIILTQEGIQGLGQFDMAKYIAGQLGYSYCQAPAFGVPGFFAYCVCIISSYPIANSQVIGCQVAGGDPIDKVPFPGSGRGLLANIGGMWVMSTHLMAPVSQENKEKQIRCLSSALPPGIVIWGGDFNFTRIDPAYRFIGLDEAVYSGEPQVDMIFSRGLTAKDARIVFADHYVSDHVGILTAY